MSVSVAQCPYDELDAIWPQVSHHIDRVMKHTGGRYTTDDAFYLLKQEEAQLFVVAVDSYISAACITQLSDYPRKLYLTILFLGGTGFDLFADLLLSKLKQFAQFESCDGIEIFGRPGWSRVLTKYGFKGDHISMELAI